MREIDEYTPEERRVIWELFRNSDDYTKVGQLRLVVDTQVRRDL